MQPCLAPVPGSLGGVQREVKEEVRERRGFQEKKASWDVLLQASSGKSEFL